MSWIALTPHDPKRVGSFDLWRRLGAGAQGVVYEGYGPRGSAVALKVLHARGRAGRPARREVEAASRVTSRWIAPVQAFDLEATPPYIATTLVRGSNLAEVVDADGPMQEKPLLGVAWAVATALSDIHASGVVHRDLKPENVIIGPDGPLVVDFGLARLSGDQQTRSSGQPGTLTYLAPELLAPDAPRAESAADIFAWGALVVFTATGHHPFERDNAAAVIDALRSEQPDLRLLPDKLRPWVAAALSKSSEGRPAAADIARGLMTDANDASLPHSDREMWLTPEQAAERLYADLSADQRDALPPILLRMVEVTWAAREGGGGDLSFRPDPLDRRDLVDASPLDPEAAQRLLCRLEEAGVAVPGPPWSLNSAVLSTWARLKSLLDGEALGLITYNLIKSTARNWDRDHDSRLLFDKRELQREEKWRAAKPCARLNQTERRFLTASREARSRAARRTKLALAVFAVLAITAVSGAVVAVLKQNESAAKTAEATSRDLAARSIATTTDPALSARLAAAAWRTSPTAEAGASLATVLARPNRGVLPGEKASRRVPPIFSPDGTTLAVADGDNRISLWDLHTHQKVGVSLAGNGLTTAMAFDPSGTMLAAGTLEGQIRVWNVATKRTVAGSIAHPARVDALAFQRDAQTLSAYGGGLLGLWNYRTGLPAAPPIRDSKGSWSSAVFSAGGQTMVVGDSKGIHQRDLVAKGQPLTTTIRSPDEYARTLAVNDGMTVLATASGGGGEEFRSSQVLLWDLRTHQKIGEIARGNKGVNTMSLSPDGRILALNQINTVQLWDVRTRARLGEPFEMPRQVGSVAFSPDGHTLATGIEDGSTWLWDVWSRRQVSTPLKDEGWVEGLAVRPDGRVVATIGDTDSTITLWSLATFQKVGRITPKEPGSVGRGIAFSPDGRMLAADIGEGPEIWDAHTLRPLRSLGNNTFASTQMAFSPDSTRLAVAGGGVQVWDVTTGKKVWQIDSPVNGAGSLAFSPDGNTIAASYGGNGEEGVASFDMKVRLLNSRTGQQLRTLNGHTSFIQAESFASDSKTIVTAGADGTVRIWAVDTGRQIGGPIDQSKAVSAIAISPDGRYLAASSENQVRFWDIASRQEIAPRLTGHKNAILAITFSPDGGTLISGGIDETARVWGMSTARSPIKAVCLIAGRSLNSEEWEKYGAKAPFHQTCPN